MLQKFIRSFPEVAKLFILVRGKKDMTLMDRVKEDIFGSFCFDKAKREFQARGQDFDAYVDQLVHPVEGDLIKPGLAMSRENRQMLTQECDVIINCAASTDFNLQLDLAIEINIDGALRMQELAHECKHLEVFCHVSTAYVNCDDIHATPQGRTIPEMIVEKEINAEKIVEYLKTRSEEEII